MRMQSVLSFCKKQPITLWMLCGVVGFFLIANTLWIQQDTSPPIWDMAGHSHRAAVTADLIAHGDVVSILTYDTIYPPFAYIVTAMHFLIFGFQVDIPQYSNALFVILYAASMWVLGKQLFQRTDITVLAVASSLLYPLLAHMTRIYELDFQQLAMVCATLAVWYKTKQLQHRGWSIAFGVIVACTLLTKWTAILFLVGPLGFLIIESLYTHWTKIEFRRRFLTHLAIAVGLAVLIAGPWFSMHLVTILISAHRTRNNVFSVPFESIWSLGNIFFYPTQIIRTVGWPVLFFSLAGSVVLFQKNKRAFLLLAIWIVVPYLIMTFLLYSKESRYFLSAYPVIAFTAASILLIQKKYIAMTGATLLLLFGLLFWSETTWNVRLFPENVYRAIHFTNYVYGYDQFGFGFPYPTQHHPDIARIAQAIQSDNAARQSSIEEQQRMRIAVVPNSMFLTAQQIQYYNVLAGVDRVSAVNTWDYQLSTLVRGDDWRAQLQQADYIITKTGDQGPEIWGKKLSAIQKEEKAKKSLFSDFELLTEYPVTTQEYTPQTVRVYFNPHPAR